MEQITVLIHGTFANPRYTDKDAEPGDEWWKITEGRGRRTTADRLQAALDELDAGASAPVWRPNPRDADLDYRDVVEWSGHNRHRARQDAAENLRRSLGRVADGRRCTASDPLRVNFVAHSHGGNVVLEALQDLPYNVRARRVGLLGTPLVWRYTDPRFAYLAILLAWTAFWLWTFGSDGLLFELVFTAVTFWALFYFIEGIRRLFRNRLARWIARNVRGHRTLGSPAYGPRPELLEDVVDDDVVLFISREDEADLMMHLGAAPMDTYRALMPGQSWLKRRRYRDGQEITTTMRPIQALWLWPRRLGERLFIRPIVYVVIIPLLELLLERFALGFSSFGVMGRNYEMVTWTKPDPYRYAIVRPLVLAKDLGQTVGRGPAAETSPPARESVPRQLWSPEDGEQPRSAEERKQKLAAVATPIAVDKIRQLRSVIRSALGRLKDQVHLNHSGYYTSDTIIEQVAGLIAGPTSPPDRGRSDDGAGAAARSGETGSRPQHHGGASSQR